MGAPRRVEWLEAELVESLSEFNGGLGALRKEVGRALWLSAIGFEVLLLRDQESRRLCGIGLASTSAVPAISGHRIGVHRGPLATSCAPSGSGGLQRVLARLGGGCARLPKCRPVQDRRLRRLNPFPARAEHIDRR